MSFNNNFNNNAYQSCVSKTSERLEELRRELFEEQEKYKRTQKIYGEVFPNLQVKSTLSLQEQINEIKSNISEIESKYSTRHQEFERVFKRLDELFTRIGVPISERGEFSSIGNEDLTQERLQRSKQRLRNLDEVVFQRENLFTSLKNRIQTLESELDEDEDEIIYELIQGEDISDESLQRLQAEESRLEELKESRLEESEELIKEIRHYYLLFAVDPSDQISTQTDLSERTLNKLRDEVEFLRENRSTRLPEVVESLTREIQKVCEQLKIPLRNRPKYHGKNVEEEILFLTEKLDELKKDQISMQPIIDVIIQIENAKDIIKKSNNNPNVNAGDRSSTRRALEDERNRRKAREELPRLEKKLLQYLVEFRNKHGYDFEFNGVNYGRSYTSASSVKDDHLENSESLGRPVRTRPDTSVSEIGKQLLLQKIHESSQGKTYKETSKNSNNRTMTKRQQTQKNNRTRTPFA